VVGLAASDPQPDACKVSADVSACKATTGTKLAINAGVGAHAFVSRWAALNFELHDLVYKNNASGRNVNGDHDSSGHNVVNSKDEEWSNNWVFSLNVQFFLPTKAKISR
jgi:hypothetical protein